jgi:ATP-dependent DNA helicase RecG
VAEIQTDNYRSSLRNKLVAEGFYLINVIEKYGSGFIRIRRALQDYPEVQFNVQEFQGGVMATFAQKQPESPDEGVNVGANVGVNSLLAYIQANPGLRAGEMAGTFTVTQRTIERWLKQLKENGVIEFRGAAKTGGYYYKNT